LKEIREKNRIPKESPTRKNWKWCWLDFIEPVHKN
jgi:hypothetical protein